jgi:hypothetical protein
LRLCRIKANLARFGQGEGHVQPKPGLRAVTVEIAPGRLLNKITTNQGSAIHESRDAQECEARAGTAQRQSRIGRSRIAVAGGAE